MLQLSQRPLQGTAVDSALFVDRTAARDAEPGDTAWFQLPRPRRSRDPGRRPSCGGSRAGSPRKASNLGSSSRVAQPTVQELVDLIHGRTHGRSRDPEERRSAAVDGSTGIIDDLRRLVPPGSDQIVLLVDSINNPEAVQHLFGRFATRSGNCRSHGSSPETAPTAVATSSRLRTPSSMRSSRSATSTRSKPRNCCGDGRSMLVLETPTLCSCSASQGRWRNR